MKRRKFCAAFGLMVGAPLGRAAADAFPSQPIRLVVPFSAGGPSDVTARIVARGMAKALGATVLVDNRPGAAVIVGSEMVARSAPDGYTILLAVPPSVYVDAMYKKVPYDVTGGFTPISTIGRIPQILVVRGGLDVSSVKAFAELLIASPGKYNFGSAGNGASDHLAAASFLAAIKAEATHVPYKGAAPALQDMLGERIDFMIESVSVMLPSIRAGKVKALAITSRERIAQLPDVPTMAEAGLPQFDVFGWYALLGPAGLPADLQARLGNACIAALRDADTRRSLEEIGVQVSENPSAEATREFLVAERQKWLGIMKGAGLQPE